MAVSDICGRMTVMFRHLAYLVQVLRLALFMLIGARIGGLPTASSHSMVEAAEMQFHGAMVGAFVGLTIELVVRLFWPIRDLQSMQFNRRTLVIVSAVTLFWIGVI